MNLALLFQGAAQAEPEAPAVARGGDVVLDQAALVDLAARLARGLRERWGLALGERVALFMTNHERYLPLMLACWWGGVVPVPVNAKLHHRELAFILEHSGARGVFGTPDLMATIAAASAALDPRPTAFDAASAAFDDLAAARPWPLTEAAADDLAWLFYTSGTTGRPKGAMITHRNLRAMTHAYALSVDQIAPGDSIIHAAPMSHGSGIYMVPHGAAGAVQVVPASGGFEATEVLELCARWPGATLFGAPTMVRRLTLSAAETRADTAGLKTIVYGGAPMYRADLDEALAVFGPKLAQIYGQGESPMTITALDRHAHARAADDPVWAQRLDTAGRAQAVCEVAIGDESGTPLPAGETGEVMVRGDSVVPGYWQDEQATNDARRGSWWCTGDVGVLDADGFLTLKDRSKDVVISGGQNIYPREVEEVLLRHPAVREVSVIGRPDAEWGEVVVAVVAGDGTIDEAALDGFCLEELARFKRPKHYVFVEALPKNAYGKVLKTELRELYG